MTITEGRGAQGDANSSSTPSARFPCGAIVALLAIIGSLLPGVTAAQAQVRLSLATVVDGRVYHKWSDSNGASWVWEDLGAPSGHTLEGTPALVSDGVGRLSVLAESDNGLWQKTYNVGWSGWFRVPGQSSTGIICVSDFLCFTLLSSPAVASWGPGRMEVFLNGSGTDGSISLLHSWADNYTWSGRWERLGTGLMQGAPGAVSWGPGRTDVFVRGGGDELDHKWFDNGHWSSGWENLGGIMTTPPVAASHGLGQWDVFTRGTDAGLWDAWFAGSFGAWVAPFPACCLAGDVTNSVAAMSQAHLTLDVFVIGTDHSLWRKRYNYYAGGWGNWEYQDHSINYTNIAATAWTPNATTDPPPSGGGGGGGGGGCLQTSCVLQ